MNATANHAEGTLGTQLQRMLGDLFAKRKESASEVQERVAAIEELLATHPLLKKYDDFQNSDIERDESEVTLRLELPLLISTSYAFETRFNFEMNENDITLSVWTNLIHFKDNAGFSSQNYVAVNEGDERSFDLNETEDIDGELDQILRAQIVFMVDTLADAGECLFGIGQKGTKDGEYKDIFRQMARYRVQPDAFAS